MALEAEPREKEHASYVEKQNPVERTENAEALRWGHV